MFNAFLEIGLVDILDMLVVATLLYSAVAALRAARAGLVLSGMAILLATYVVADQLGMQLTAWMFQGFFAVFVVIVVVVFQTELRRVFERIAVLGLGRGPVNHAGSIVADVLVRVVADLAASRTGALFVLPGLDPIERHVEGGTVLRGTLSEPLLLSLFDASSPGHDGAVVLQSDRVERFAVQLPLSRRFHQLEGRGTRHSAALGLSEVCDALCIVVSEERGTVSVARAGALRELSRPEALTPELRSFLDDLSPRRSRREAFTRALRRRLPEKTLAVILAAGLWVAFVPGGEQVERRYSLPVAVENLPPGYEVESIQPEQVEVLLGGLRRSFYLLTEARIAVRLDAQLADLGRRTFELTDASVRCPVDITVTDLIPRRVRLDLRRIPLADQDPGTTQRK